MPSSLSKHIADSVRKIKYKLHEQIDAEQSKSALLPEPFELFQRQSIRQRSAARHRPAIRFFKRRGNMMARRISSVHPSIASAS
jgi:hypothetical protein